MDTILGDQIFFLKEEIKETSIDSNDSMWIVDGSIIRPSTEVTINRKLEPGMYVVDSNQQYGIHCRKSSFCSDELFILPNSGVNELIKEINMFWEKGVEYKKNHLIHKRGMLIEGGPGFGKSSLISLLSKEIINKGGVVFKVQSPQKLFYHIAFIKDFFRKIEPDTPIITIIEDINDYNDVYFDLLDFLDGKNNIEHHVVIATSNNTENIEDTLLRPSRIDLRVKVQLPSEEVRREYFLHKQVPEDKIEELVEKSKGFSIADIKELYICIFLLEYNIDSAVKKIKNDVKKVNYLSKKSNKESMAL